MERCSMLCAAWKGGVWGRMDMYGWVPSLFSWNYHNIVNWLYSNTKLKVVKKKKNFESEATESFGDLLAACWYQQTSGWCPLSPKPQGETGVVPRSSWGPSFQPDQQEPPRTLQHLQGSCGVDFCFKFLKNRSESDSHATLQGHFSNCKELAPALC